jgi:hypothetical protein
MDGPDEGFDGARDRALGGRVPPSRSPERPSYPLAVTVAPTGAGAAR